MKDKFYKGLGFEVKFGGENIEITEGIDITYDPKMISKRDSKGRFIKGSKPWNNQLKGIHLSPATEYKKGQLADEKHHLWKGDNAGYTAKHQWIVRKLGSPKLCDHCGTTSAKKYEWANVSGKYLMRVSDYIRLCKPCHRIYDNQNKLSLSDIKKIKAKLHNGMTQKEIALQFGVHQSTISYINGDKTWLQN